MTCNPQKKILLAKFSKVIGFYRIALINSVYIWANISPQSLVGQLTNQILNINMGLYNRIAPVSDWKLNLVNFTYGVIAVLESRVFVHPQPPVVHEVLPCDQGCQDRTSEPISLLLFSWWADKRQRSKIINNGEIVAGCPHPSALPMMTGSHSL